MPRVRLQLFSPKLFYNYRTKPIGQGEVHLILGQHLHTDKWTIQALTFLYPSDKFQTLSSIYKWYAKHKKSFKKAHAKHIVLEHGGQKVKNYGLGAIDQFTERHLLQWLDRRFGIDTPEAFEAYNLIRHLLDEEPELLKDRSWPDILRMAQRLSV